VPVPAAVVLVPLEGVVPVPPEAAVPVPAAVVLELLLLVVLVDELVLSPTLLLAPEVGTVKPGAPAVLVVPEPPLPQAARQRAVAMAAPAPTADL
jgi:hypothetical protein